MRWSDQPCTTIATRTPRTKRSPTTEPIDPPMNSNSNAAATTPSDLTAPCITTRASVSPVASSEAVRAISFCPAASLTAQRLMDVTEQALYEDGDESRRASDLASARPSTLLR